MNEEKYKECMERLHACHDFKNALSEVHRLSKCDRNSESYKREMDYLSVHPYAIKSGLCRANMRIAALKKAIKEYAVNKNNGLDDPF